MTGESTLWMRYLSTKKAVKTGGLGRVLSRKASVRQWVLENVLIAPGVSLLAGHKRAVIRQFLNIT